MIVLIQRVLRSSVEVDNKKVGKINKGFLIFLAIKETDTDEDFDYVFKKVVNLRILDDKNGKMNLSLKEYNKINKINEKPNILLVSQFLPYVPHPELYGPACGGIAPSFGRGVQTPYPYPPLQPKFSPASQHTSPAYIFPHSTW